MMSSFISCSSTSEDSYNEEHDKWTEEIQPIKLNPFLIPHVLQQVLSYCEFDSLKQTRLVSRLWEECGKIYFSQKRTLRFKHLLQIEDFLVQQENDHLDSHLCQNLSLHGPDFQDWLILLKPFFAKFGSYIKSINVSYGLGDVTEDLLLQIAQHIDSLEELSISGATVVFNLFDRFGGGGGGRRADPAGSGFSFQTSLPTVKRIKLKLPVTCFKEWSAVRRFFTDFFTTFDNVESIKFVGSQFPELFRYLPESIRFPRLNELHLQLLNSSGLDKLMGRGFFIEKMTLEVEPLLGLDNLHAFLESYSHCLKHLELIFHYKGEYNYSHNATAFPSSKNLRKLEKLKLFGYWGDLYFLKEFPSPLKSVTVEKMNWAIAFPKGTDEVGKYIRKIMKFYDESDVYHELNY